MLWVAFPALARGRAWMPLQSLPALVFYDSVFHNNRILEWGSCSVPCTWLEVRNLERTSTVLDRFSRPTRAVWIHVDEEFSKNCVPIAVVLWDGECSCTQVLQAGFHRQLVGVGNSWPGWCRVLPKIWGWDIIYTHSCPCWLAMAGPVWTVCWAS